MPQEHGNGIRPFLPVHCKVRSKVLMFFWREKITLFIEHICNHCMLSKQSLCAERSNVARIGGDLTYSPPIDHVKSRVWSLCYLEYSETSLI